MEGGLAQMLWIKFQTLLNKIKIGVNEKDGKDDKRKQILFI